MSGVRELKRVGQSRALSPSTPEKEVGEEINISSGVQRTDLLGVVQAPKLDV